MDLTGPWYWPPTFILLRWGPFELARFVGGRLIAEGYEVQLARQGGNWWPVVWIEGGGIRLAVPLQVRLKELPSGEVRPEVRVARDEENTLWGFDPAFCAWERLEPLPHNVPPRAGMVAPVTSVQVGEPAFFSASPAYDPDGAIVSYYWDFGDGDTDAALTTTHVYAQPAGYQVTLVVVDEGGLVDRATISVAVGVELPPGDGCGCGG